jgi:hypothetical protein
MTDTLVLSALKEKRIQGDSQIETVLGQLMRVLKSLDR